MNEKKQKQLQKELPLNEDYQESGKKYEFETSEGREKARSLATKLPITNKQS